jgi:hypothetical protein
MKIISKGYSLEQEREQVHPDFVTAVSAEVRVRSWVSPCGICGGQSGTGTGFPPSTSVFPCQFYSTWAPLLGKIKKLIIFITGLHNKLQGCDASVASAAGPFTTKKNTFSNCLTSLFSHAYYFFSINEYGPSELFTYPH